MSAVLLNVNPMGIEFCVYSSELFFLSNTAVTFILKDKLLVFDKEHAKRTHVHDAQVRYTLSFILVRYSMQIHQTLSLLSSHGN
jgi:hypothetical protein